MVFYYPSNLVTEINTVLGQRIVKTDQIDETDSGKSVAENFYRHLDVLKFSSSHITKN